MRITLADGREIKNLIFSFDNEIFISEKPINKDIFKDNLSKIVVGGDNHRNRDNIHYDMELVYFEKKPYIDYKSAWFFKLQKKERQLNV